eukprot:gnl/Spiro4/21728_TR10644_c0_g1_i1.p1 gnl/Spiro4/21728_TR10644_c0_g1~~gnl/Spiro4/21728_TR10644_c0_g1_i1.p1  ORF type:complete len:580 (-),score=126.76 gnl/Spiro4/21728_TR10644_c0_g1_i1:48-1787(-)
MEESSEQQPRRAISQFIFCAGLLMAFVLGWFQFTYGTAVMLPCSIMLLLYHRKVSIEENSVKRTPCRTPQLKHKNWESVMWLNTLLRRIWVQASPEISASLHSQVSGILAEKLSAYSWLPVGVSLDRLNLGATFPTLQDLQVNATASNIYELDFSAAYFSDLEVVASVFIKRARIFGALPLAVRDLSLRTRVRLEIRFIGAAPFVSRVRVTLDGPPEIRLSVCIGSLNLLYVPLLNSFVWKQVHAVIAGIIVYPNEYVWQDDNKYEALKRTGPVVKGVVEIRVVEARNLAAADQGGTSDPYALLQLMRSDGTLTPPEPKRTKTIKATLNPSWNEVFRFDVSDLCRESVFIRVRDYDFVGSDDDLGETELSLAQMYFIRARDFWLELQKTHTGTIHLYVRFRAIDSRVTAMQRAAAMHRITARRGDSCVNSSSDAPASVDVGAVVAPGPCELQMNFLAAEIINKNGKHVEYLIECQLGQRKWTVSKRFSEFRAFYLQVSKLYPKIRHVEFPPRTLTTSLSQATISQRKARLQQYLQEITILLDAEQRQELYQFLGAPGSALGPRRRRTPSVASSVPESHQ